MDAAELFARHYDPLVRYLARLSGDHELAADAAQEAFVRLVERAPRQSNLRAWLFTVGTNIVRDTTSRRTRIAALHRLPDRLPLPASPPDPEELLESKQRRERVRAALEGLSWKERTLLLMSEEGFTHREMAAAVETTTGSVGTMLIRARRKLLGQLVSTAADPG